MKKLISALTFLCLIITSASAQVVTTNPIFPVDGNDSVIVFFDATQGNQGLNNFTGDVYVHTGIVTASASSTSWTNVVTTWGVANAAWKVTPLGNNKYKFKINNLRTFYSATPTQVIYKIAILFRDATGSNVGRGQNGADIYIPVIQAGAFIGNFITPTSNINVVPANSPVTCIYQCSKLSTISIFKNNVLQRSVSNKDTVHYTTNANSTITKIKITANDGLQTLADSVSFTVSPAVQTQALPAGVKDGINYNSNTSVTLVLVAPNKTNVYAFGDFSDWGLDTNYYLKKTPDGKRWWVTINNLIPNKQYAYQYLVDGDIRIADPYTEMVLDPFNDGFINSTLYPNLMQYPSGKTTDIVSTFHVGKTPYNWQHTATYQKPNQTNLIVYELLMRDFLASHSYQDLIDTIPYFKKLGINAIEFMPINEFEGNESWGYNPSFYFAADKYYGPADSLKRFIDLCHKENIAVIIDQVLNHSFSQSPMCKLYWDTNKFEPATNNPWYNADCDPATPGYQGKHPFGVGYDFNHESVYTKRFVYDVNKYWVNEFKIDGFRFDLSKGFTQKFSGNNVGLWGNYDQTRIDIWKEYADSIWSVDSSTYIILEHFADNSEEKVLTDYGMMVWGNITNGYYESAMGYTASNNINYVSYKDRAWNKSGLVGYMESHDEERTVYKCVQFGNSTAGYNVKNLGTAIDRIKTNAAFFFTVPGPKMIWQFGELGYDFSINRCEDGSINNNCRLSKKPIRWDYYTNNYDRKILFNNFSALIKLKTTYPQTFNTANFTLNGGNGNFKTLYLNDPSMNAAIVGNFGLTAGMTNVNFQSTGKWYNYYTGDSINVTTLPYSQTLAAGEFKIYTNKLIPKPSAANPVVGIDYVAPTSNPIVYFSQNFPNPITSTSTVQFGFSKETKVKIEVLDLTGKKLNTLLNEKFIKGDYELELDAQNFNTGIYILKFITEEGFTKSIRINVVK
jgi:1,4-alpha-glucan branching enzyme